MPNLKWSPHPFRTPMHGALSLWRLNTTTQWLKSFFLQPHLKVSIPAMPLILWKPYFQVIETLAFGLCGPWTREQRLNIKKMLLHPQKKRPFVASQTCKGSSSALPHVRSVRRSTLFLWLTDRGTPYPTPLWPFRVRSGRLLHRAAARLAWWALQTNGSALNNISEVCQSCYGVLWNNGGGGAAVLMMTVSKGIWLVWR